MSQQKNGNNEIWINRCETEILRMNQSEAVKVEGTKVMDEVYNMKDPVIPEEVERNTEFRTVRAERESSWLEKVRRTEDKNRKLV